MMLYRVLGAVALALGCLAVPASAAIEYTITDLGTLANDGSTASALL